MEKRAEMGGYPVFEIFTGYGTGIHFGGRTMDNLLLDFGNMPFARQSASEKPGIGLLPAEAGGEARRIIIPDVGTKNRDLPQIE
jgi:S-DNA-T family DNA segregation ATPase FtsK/SpoIIIE